MRHEHERGATLAVGLVLLSLVTLLGLAAVGNAHVERLLAQNETFRENAASAASAGIEMAIRAIVTSPDPAAIPALLTGNMPGSNDRFEVSLRFVGYEASLPQVPGAGLAGAHFEIVSNGFAARRAMDRQRAGVMRVVEAPALASAADCQPVVALHCHQAGGLERLSWQRIPRP